MHNIRCTQYWVQMFWRFPLLQRLVLSKDMRGADHQSGVDKEWQDIVTALQGMGSLIHLRVGLQKRWAPAPGICVFHGAFIASK